MNLVKYANDCFSEIYCYIEVVFLGSAKCRCNRERERRGLNHVLISYRVRWGDVSQRSWAAMSCSWSTISFTEFGRDELFLDRYGLFFSEGGFQFLAKVASSSDGRGWSGRFLTGEGASLPMSGIVPGRWTGSTSAPPNVGFFRHRKVRKLTY